MRQWLLVLILILAGCTTKEPEPEAPQVDLTVGTIRGSTVTPLIQPIAGATVTVEGLGTTESNLFGGFIFQLVPPGSYRITATAEDHEPSETTVTVTGGEITRPRMILQPILPPVASHDTEPFRGYVNATFGPADDAAGPVKDAAGYACICEFTLEGRPGLASITVEATWEDSLQGPEPAEFRWTVTLASGNSTTGTGADPLLVDLRSADLGDLNETAFTVRLEPSDTWPSYDQSYELFVTRWVVDPAPPGWSFINGDE